MYDRYNINIFTIVTMIIALLTDFGHRDPYVGMVKAVLYRHGFNGFIVDICHDIVPYSIEHAQFMLYTTYSFFPAHTIIMSVIDPGVGTQRNILLATDGIYYFLAPDNGLLSCIKNLVDVWAVETEAFKNASSTFHARDIFAVIAARLASSGIDAIAKRQVHEYIHTPFPYFCLNNGAIVCRIMHVDRFGNCILSLPNDRYHVSLQKAVVHDRDVMVHHCKTYADLPNGAVGLLQGSSGFVELCMRENDCSGTLGLHIGDGVTLVYG